MVIMIDQSVRAGDCYTASGFDEVRILVLRVAPDKSWADICVSPREGAGWTKRQPLQGGHFPYPVEGIYGER